MRDISSLERYLDRQLYHVLDPTEIEDPLPSTFYSVPSTFYFLPKAQSQMFDQVLNAPLCLNSIFSSIRYNCDCMQTRFSGSEVKKYPFKVNIKGTI